MDARAESEPDGAGVVAGYRPVSPLAVAAGLVGLASALALLSPVFWVVPLVGTALAIAALADVGRRDLPKAGRLAALAGLGLALGFGVQALAAAATGEWLARGRTTAAVRFWLDTIAAGRLDDARSMCRAGAGAAVDRVAACAPATVRGVHCLGRDAETGGRVVRVAVGDCGFDVVIESTPPVGGGEPERLTVARCDAVTPSAN